jgi:hypothetical protein
MGPSLPLTQPIAVTCSILDERNGGPQPRSITHSNVHHARWPATARCLRRPGLLALEPRRLWSAPGATVRPTAHHRQPRRVPARPGEACATGCPRSQVTDARPTGMGYEADGQHGNSDPSDQPAHDLPTGSRNRPDSAGPRWMETVTAPDRFSLVRGRSFCWWRVKDSNLRSFRDGFTVRSHWPLGQPAWRAQG